MSTGYLPANDTQFSAWVDNFGAYLTPNYARLGLAVTDLDAFDDEHPIWDVKLATHVEAQMMAKSHCAAKNDERVTFDNLIRSLVAQINAHPATTDADREALGIKSPVPVPAPGSGVPPDDKPLAIIDVSARLKHVMRVQNQTLTGTQKSKPANAIGCEVWRTVGDAPTDIDDMQYVGLVTRSPYEIAYSGADGGKQAHYALRWVNSKGEPGSWSETESATIAA